MHKTGEFLLMRPDAMYKIDAASKGATRPAERTQPTFIGIVSENLLFCPCSQALGALERKVVMSRVLPIRPDLEHLKNDAKSLLKAQKRGGPSVCPIFRKLKRFIAASDAEMLSSRVLLTEVQFALAQSYGFKNWDALRRVALSVQPLAGSETPACSGAILLPSPPVGQSGNRFARAYHPAVPGVS